VKPIENALECRRCHGREKEIQDYFLKHRGLFIQLAYASVIYKFAIDKGTVDRWEKILAATGDFGEAANITPTSVSPHLPGGGDGYSRVRVYQGDNQLKELQEQIFKMKEGESRVLKSPMGYYLMQIEQVQAMRYLTLEEAADEVKTRMIDQRISERISQRVDALVTPVKVDVVGELSPAQPQQDIPNPDLG